MESKKAVVTGSSSGIGKEIVLQLLENGHSVYGLSRRDGGIKHPNFHFIKTNVRDVKEVDAAFDQIGACDFLVNNAGLGKFSLIEKTSLEDWHEMFDTNVNGIFYCTRRVIENMKRKGSGHIINIASTAGLEGYATATAYCGTKHAVRGISQALYKEVRDYGVKITCVYPGSVKTDFFQHHPNIEPHNNMLNPAEVANMLVAALESSGSFHQVNLEVRPLQPQGAKIWK